MQKLKWRVSFKNEMPATWTIWHLYKVRKIPARSSSRARFFNLAQAVWCISSKNEGEKRCQVLEWNPSSLFQGWVLNLLVLSQFFGIQEEKLHHWWNQSVWLFFREADNETNVVLKRINLIKLRNERNKNQFYKLSHLSEAWAPRFSSDTQPSYVSLVRSSWSQFCCLHFKELT